MVDNIKYALSNEDLNNFIKETDDKGVNIFDVSKITPDTDIEAVYKNRGHAVFFVPPYSMGHWISTLRTPDSKIYFMDSLSEKPDHYSKNIMKCFKNNKIKTIYINKTPLQVDDDSVTCGRFAVIFTALHKLEIPPSDMIDFLIDGGKKMGSVDKFVFKLTKEI